MPEKKEPFRPKIGGVEQHVTHPAEHHGYRHLVANYIYKGSHAYYIKGRCAKAQEMGLPKDIISFDEKDGSYMTLADINVEVNDGGMNRQFRQGIHDYALALKQYNDRGGR